MVGHQSPGVARDFLEDQGFVQAVEEVFAVNFILEDLLTFDPSKDEMMEGTGHVDAGFSGNAGRVAEASFIANL